MNEISVIREQDEHAQTETQCSFSNEIFTCKNLPSIIFFCLVMTYHQQKNERTKGETEERTRRKISLVSLFLSLFFFFFFFLFFSYRKKIEQKFLILFCFVLFKPVLHDWVMVYNKKDDGLFGHNQS